MDKSIITGFGPEPAVPEQKSLEQGNSGQGGCCGVDLEAAIRNFRDNRFLVSHFATAAEAADYLDSEIRGKTVGFGDSATLEAMGLAERLGKHNYVVDPASHPKEIFGHLAEKAMQTDIFLLSVNAASETGELVNIDGSGNRVAGSLFGHEKVYYVFSANKLEPTLEKAIWRARNIAAPKNAKRLGYKTPCAVKADRCYNCKSPDRICNKLVIYMKHGRRVKEEIVIIDEALGF